MPRRPRLIPLTALVLLVGLTACDTPQERENATPAPASPLVRGVLSLSAYSALPDADEGRPGLPHTTTFVRAQLATTMEDNDIRGFLAGGFVHGWNQVGQTHIRIGRGPWTAKFGENEILRGLQRWDALGLPQSVLVESASLSMAIEKGPDEGLDVLLYAVSKDWVPGSGGAFHNNISSPAPGEVWWQDVGFSEEAWALPGAGFASDTDPNADTAATPLASARFEPGNAHLTFESARLGAYVQHRTRARKPLLLLLKLSDPQEDTTGPVLFVYSADYGEHKSPERRPRLRVSWSSPDQRAERQEPIIVEPGRSVVLPRLEVSGASHFAASFAPEAGSGNPWIEVRGGEGASEAPWRPVGGVFQANWDWIEVRVLAARNPVAFGSAFETELRDTWIRTKAPEDQRVVFEFVAPSGALHRVDANYLGEFRWAVEFEPQELGRWRYTWSHEFVSEPHRGPDTVFDVLAQDVEPVLDALDTLRGEIDRSALASADERVARFEHEFHALERAAIQLLGPQDSSSERGRRARTLIGEIRTALGSRPLPAGPSDWAKPWLH